MYLWMYRQLSPDYFGPEKHADSQAGSGVTRSFSVISMQISGYLFAVDIIIKISSECKSH